MTMKSKILTALAATTVAMGAAPAAATTFNPVYYTFDFTDLSNLTTTGSKPNNTGAVGNSVSETVGGITVTATAWSIDKSIGRPANTTTLTSSQLGLSQAHLGQYDGLGLGVTDKYEDGSSPNHTIDNSGAYDFVVLQFSQPVQLLNGYLVPFTGDNDSWVSFEDVAKGTTPITDPKVFANMMLHATYVDGNLSSAQNYKTFLNGGMNTGWEWIIGADAFTGDAKNDGFKLAGITVQLPVPEPATWASMILGLGFVGAAMRRRRQGSTTLTYA